MKKTLIVGTVAYDEIETVKGNSGKVLGGAGTYIALSCSHFKSNSSVVSVVGGDFEKKYLALLESKGVDVSAIEIIKNGKTFYWKGKYHKDWNKRDTLATELNVLADFNPKVPEEFKRPDVLILGNLHPIVQGAVLNQLSKKPTAIILDTMNFWMDTALEDLTKIIKRVNVVVINDEEAMQLSGKETLFSAAEEILKLGPKYVVIKKGEHGAMLFGEDHFFISPAYPVKNVVDPTGAGDSFAGGLGGYLSEKSELSFENLKKGIVYGTI
ncbi:MAG: PfkB family carbohydrate kinase, partial [Flavobacteriaceae bacterium]|nr:PfkB family carbohydrate kinase [Flavobacteriaceae bacterium]